LPSAPGVIAIDPAGIRSTADESSGVLPMKCASCGRDNPAGAHYCVHCGTEQASTPMAVAAAANAVRPRSPVPQAANAPQADSLPASRRSAKAERARPTRHYVDAFGADTQPPAFPAGSDPFDVSGGAYTGTPPRTPPSSPAAIPVYAAHPRRLGIAALLVALCVIVALIAFVVWKTQMPAGAPAAPPDAADTDNDASVMSGFPPNATPQRPPRAGAPSTRGPSEGPSGTSAADATPAGGASTADGLTAPAPVEIKPLPVKPARKAAVATAPKTPPPSAPVVEPEPAPPPVVAAPRKDPPVVDRWVQMAEDLSRCTREDFISRVICDQRVRFRYCDGYWGKTPQCPGNPVPDRR